MIHRRRLLRSRPIRSIAAACAASAGALWGLSGCGDGGSESAAGSDVTAAAPTGESVRVSAIDNIFRPEEITVAAGTELVWTNDGRNDHNVLPVGDFDFGVEIEEFEPGQEYSHLFDIPGTYPYYCSLHGTETAGMIGTVVVE